MVEYEGWQTKLSRGCLWKIHPSKIRWTKAGPSMTTFSPLSELCVPYRVSAGRSPRIPILCSLLMCCDARLWDQPYKLLQPHSFTLIAQTRRMGPFVTLYPDCGCSRHFKGLRLPQLFLLIRSLHVRTTLQGSLGAFRLWSRPMSPMPPMLGYGLQLLQRQPITALGL